MKPRIQWGRLLRRSLALFLATLAVWALLVCSGGGSAANAFRSLGQDPGFVSAALSAELGQVAEDDGPLSGLSGWLVGIQRRLRLERHRIWLEGYKEGREASPW